MTSISDVVSVAAGNGHTVALKRDGTVWTWGRNLEGELGDGTTTNRNSPVQVSITNVVAVAAGLYHSVALKKDGTVWMWGADNTTSGTTPRQVSGLRGVSQIAAAWDHSLALQTDGERSGVLWAWGNGTPGAYGSALGDGTASARSTPVRVASLSNAVLVSTGESNALALTQDGSLWAWGHNVYGQLGDGTSTDQAVPEMIGTSFNGANVLSMTVARNTSLVTTNVRLGARNITWGWGYNYQSSIGDGTVNSGYTYPVQNLMSNADTVVGGSGYQVLALTRDSSVWSWGNNTYGMLGQGNTTDSPTPTVISGFALADNDWVLDDSDGDGLDSWLELEYGSDPTNADTNGDGIRDNAAYGTGLSATNPDVDGDGISNILERQRGTDPLRTDTDNDGTNDAADCFALDPSRQTCPSSNPSDSTPPSITLTRPTNATLTGSNP